MTCDAAIPAKVFPPKDPTEALDYFVDFEQFCARQWSKWTDITVGTCIRVYIEGSKGGASGYELRATTSGRTGGKFPNFPQVAGVQVIDGSVIWITQALSTSSLRATISGTPTWTAAGLTVSNPQLVGFMAAAVLSGGTDGSDYEILVQASLSNGTTPIQVCSLPVRRAVKVCADA
jgi:hypothetical protein